MVNTYLETLIPVSFISYCSLNVYKSLILVSLRGTPSESNSIFKEFLIQARSTISNTSVGTFQSRESRRQKYKLTCDQNVR